MSSPTSVRALVEGAGCGGEGPGGEVAGATGVAGANSFWACSSNRSISDCPIRLASSAMGIRSFATCEPSWSAIRGCGLERRGTDRRRCPSYCSKYEKLLKITDFKTGLPNRVLLFSKIRRLIKANPGSARSLVRGIADFDQYLVSKSVDVAFDQELGVLGFHFGNGTVQGGTPRRAKLPHLAGLP